MATTTITARRAPAGHEGGIGLDGKRLAARYFFGHELPRTDAWFDLLDSGDTLLADLDDSVL